MLKKIAFAFSIYLLSACAYEIGDYSPQNVQKFLSVQAILNDQASEQVVKLFYSAAGLTNNFISEPVLKAKVYLKDDKGKIENYFEQKEFGIYKPVSTFTGVVGTTYQLFIETPDGKKYESSKQRINPCPSITTGYSEPNLKENLSINDRFRGGYDVFIDFKDDPEKQFYRWSWTHYKRIGVCAVCPNGWDFFTNECRKPGRFQTNNGIPFKYYCKGRCWDIERSTDINILNDNFINGKEAKKIFIKRIPYLGDDNAAPGESHYLQVYQQSISEEAYKYYQALQAQQSAGTYFDIPALTLFSINIKCITNPEDKILGIFDVYSAKRKIVIADISQDIKGAIKQYTLVQGVDPCIVLPCPIPCIPTETRTSIRPEGWVERAID